MPHYLWICSHCGKEENHYVNPTQEEQKINCGTCGACMKKDQQLFEDLGNYISAEDRFINAEL